jgi:hypothetical protein
MALGDRIPTPRSEALKPMLWYLGITLSPTAVASFSGNDRVLSWMLIFAAAGVASFLAAYWWLLIMYPDRLQSEAYMTRLLGDDRSGREALDEPPEAPTRPGVRR